MRNRTTWDRLRVKPGRPARLARRDPGSTAGVKDKDEAAARLAAAQEKLAELQDRLYADNRHGLLVVLQGMDASGKDGTIRKICGGFNPIGVQVVSFKAPSAEELDHDFLWRIHAAAPRRGDIAIWNRSHYEDVLIVRVKGLVPREVWKARYDQINAFERILARDGTVVLKFCLHISKDEQRERLKDRLVDPRKNWKFNPDDLKERLRWDDYQKAYEEALSRCSTDVAPWYVVPADRKWYRNVVIAETIVEALESLRLEYPPLSIDPKTIEIP
ncbi:MAG: polyphosphate kinase 2 family protein [Acidobacteriota bacterium]